MHLHLFASMLGLACILTLPGQLLKGESHQQPHYPSQKCVGSCAAHQGVSSRFTRQTALPELSVRFIRRHMRQWDTF